MNESELLELEKQKFRLIAAVINDGVIIVDTSQKITFMNRAAEEMTGYQLSEVLDKEIGNILVLLDESNTNIYAAQYCPLGEIDMEGLIYENTHLKLVDKGDKIRDIKIESRKMKAGSQANIGCIVVIKDVTQARELEKMKIDFTSMAVHVLRTPLTILRGYLNELSKGDTLAKLNEREIDNVSSAIAGAKELNTLIEDLLHLSEIQQGNFKIYPIAVNYEGLLSSVVLSFESAAHAKGLSIIYNAPLYEFPMIRADIQRIKELLSNLISNAIKFTDKGFIEIKLNLDKTAITTSITDTGKGIPRDKIKAIFQKFYRDKDNPLSMSEGYGLGLYISSKIVEAHKGKIWVESKEGVGSTFYFTLPLV